MILRNVSRAVKQLTPAEGFVMNMTPAREDGKARLACNKFFGKDKVDKVTNTLHRSRLNYESLMEDFLEYDREHVKKSVLDQDSNLIYQCVLQSIRNDLGKQSITPLSFMEVRKLADFPGSKSPGLPYKNQGYKTKAEVFDDEKNLEHLEHLWNQVENGKNVHLPDVCLFARSQIAKYPKQKIRATWGYSFDVYMEEARFFYPIQNFIKSHAHELPIAYGLEMAHGGMNSINDMLVRHKGGKYVISDWSKFDKTIPPWLIRDAFAILEGLIDFSACGRVSQQKRRFKKIVDYFVETPLRTCKGERFLVTGGVPSGSCFTNIIDSIINCIVTRFLIYQTTNAFPVGEIFLGDDGVFIIEQGFACLEDIASLAIKYFGMILNIDKSYVTTNPSNVHFLGYFNYYGFPFKNQDFLIASFIFPEHKRTKLIDACAAALGQMYSGFDSGYARKWLDIIHFLADLEDKNPFSTSEIILHLKNNEFRHKYLAQVGLTADSMTLPNRHNSLILEVLPKTYCSIRLPTRTYNYKELYLQTCE
uniref:RNA-dependent RNA polymerase n=1 Tax=Vera virus TaxID=2759332 RepID=A0A7D6WSU5_9VIRU|nr:RNA-dependent RNA polymerase [Vera virus]QMI58125.1 RNA-dependent RNA polymerase [Vera virus]